MITTRLTEMFGLTHPVMSAPMAMHSGGTLAAAVTAAGGLGSFGGVNPHGPDWVREQAAIVRAATDGPFGIGFITPFMRGTRALFDAAVECEPDVIAFSFSDPAEWIAPARAAGSKIVCQVQDPATAEQAIDAGTDVIVVQGNDAGGHTGEQGQSALLSHVITEYPNVPVLVAGGVADGATLAAALVAGADGAWLGTAFLATHEAIEIGDDHKQAIVDSDGSDTVFTRAHDILSGLPWPEHVGERVGRTAFTDTWDGREAELRSRRDEIAANDPPADPFLFGSSAGLVHEVLPAGDVVRSISDDAERILRTRPSELLSPGT